MNAKMFLCVALCLGMAKTAFADISISEVTTKSFWGCKKVSCDIRNEGMNFQREVSESMKKGRTMVLSVKSGYYWSEEGNKFKRKDDKISKVIVNKGVLTSIGKMNYSTYKDKRKMYDCVEFPVHLEIKTFDGILQKVVSGKMHVSSGGYIFHIHDNDGKIYGRAASKYNDIGDLDYAFTDHELTAIDEFLHPFKYSSSITLNKDSWSNEQIKLNVCQSVLYNRIVFRYDSMEEHRYMIGRDNNWYLQKVHDYGNKLHFDTPIRVNNQQVVDTLNFAKDVLGITALYEG